MTELDERLARAVRAAYERTPPLDPTARERILDALRAEASPGPGMRSFGWLLRPRTLRLAPLAGVMAALALVLAGSFAGWVSRDRMREATPDSYLVDRGAAPGRVVEFVLVAPNAARVALVGDFNGWDIEAAPMRRVNAGDTWRIAVPLAEGRHVYAFVVDGSRWLADPAAPLAPEDGFGYRNSVVVVARPEPT